MRRFSRIFFMFAFLLPFDSFASDNPFEEFERDEMYCFYVGQHGSFEMRFHHLDGELYIDGVNVSAGDMNSEVSRKEGEQAYIAVLDIGLTALTVYVNFDTIESRAKAMGSTADGLCQMR